MKIIIETKDGMPMKGYEIGPLDKPPAIISIGMWGFVHKKTEPRGPGGERYEIYREGVSHRLVGGENAAPITGDEWEDIELEAQRKGREAAKLVAQGQVIAHCPRCGLHMNVLEKRDGEAYMRCGNKDNGAPEEGNPLSCWASGEIWKLPRVFLEPMILPDANAHDDFGPPIDIRGTKIHEPKENPPTTVALPAVSSHWLLDNETPDAGDTWMVTAIEGNSIRFESLREGPCSIDVADWENNIKRGWLKPLTTPQAAAPKVCQACGGTRRATNSEGQASTTEPCQVCASDTPGIYDAQGRFIPDAPKAPIAQVEMTEEDRTKLEALRATGWGPGKE